jgi:hypothetical protein
MNKRVKYYRSKQGFSLIEMFAALFITAYVAAAIGELCVVQNVVGFRIYNKLDALINARRIASYIEADVHSARFVGDQFGISPNQFPGSGPFDPYTGSGSTYSGFSGYPGSTGNTTWPAVPYSLDPQTLILQVPVYTYDPTLLPNYVPLYPTKTQNGFWNVDTYVYKVLADTTQPGKGQFIIQKAVFPGDHTTPTDVMPLPAIPSNQPQTLVSGVIGPIDPSQAPDPVAGTPPPKVFSYLSRQSPIYQSGTPIPNASHTQVTASDVPNINGVGITMEIFSASASQREDLVPQSLAFHNEFYLKGNYTSTP